MCKEEVNILEEEEDIIPEKVALVDEILGDNRPAASNHLDGHM